MADQFLGKPCIHNHECPDHPGKNWRYKSNGNCLACKAAKRKGRPAPMSPEHRKARNKEIQAKHNSTAARKQYRREWAAMRYRTDESYRITECLRSRLRKAVKSYSAGDSPSPSLHGIDWTAIVEHLGPCPGLRHEWHIDHIIPCCVFDHSNLEQVHICWAPENLRWLPKVNNRRKIEEDKKKSLRAQTQPLDTGN